MIYTKGTSIFFDSSQYFLNILCLLQVASYLLGKILIHHFSRYHALTSVNETNGWYGGTLLGDEDENSDIYRHYAELIQVLRNNFFFSLSTLQLVRLIQFLCICVIVEYHFCGHCRVLQWNHLNMT